MKMRVIALASLSFALAALPAGAASDAMTNAPVDPAISALVARVDEANLRTTDATLVGFGTRNDFSETTSTATHGVFGARDWIKAQFEKVAERSGGRMTVSLDTYLQPKTPKTPRAVTESSVVATLTGDEPGRVYVMSSHFDDCDGDCTDGKGVAPGADDNGSGVSAVLEAARVMADTHFRGTIVFACFDGEELGLWGSAHFAKLLHSRHAYVAANLNNDIIGNTAGGDGSHEPNVVRLFSEALPAGAQIDKTNAAGSENDSTSRELSRFVAVTVPSYVNDFSVREIYRADRFLRGGDQESFQAEGFPAVRFVEPHEHFAHQHQNVRKEAGVQYGDLPEYLDYAYLARVTRANVASLAALALGPDRPQDAQLVMRKLGYDSTLRWKPVAGAAAYEIVWRASSASDWQFSRNVGAVTEATVPVSKDDYILGVRAVDAAGHRSVVSYPTPIRLKP